MNALNYGPAPRFAAPFAIVAEPRVRRACMAAGAALIVIAATVIIQAVRIDAATREQSDLTERLATLDVSVSPIRVMAREVTRFDAIETRVRDLRASARASANAVAALGNRLPHDVWLTALRAGPQSIALDGRSAHLASLAAAMTSLRASSERQARLINVAVDPARGGLSYAIVVREGK